MDPARGERPLNADPAAQLRLLEVQALDLRLDQIVHRLRTLPEVAELERLAAEHTRLRDLEVSASTEVADLERDRGRAESDVAQVRARKARDQQRLDAGQVSSPRELEQLQHEIASLERRQGDLEDVELEIMERLEEAQQRQAGLAAQRDDVATKAADVQRARDAAFAELDKDAEYVRQQRGTVVGDVPDDLLALYAKLREQHGGIGAAALKQRRCEGCHLQLDPADVNRIRAAAPDAVVRCGECRRILVRTDESGL
ncbi:MAG TPA: C4-type zinc ribbon domain-containing protein [Jiangellales bacterium]|nr:C4-type zinc ribbon domain-containing protein [Jiangellales bacterium]